MRTALLLVCLAGTLTAQGFDTLYFSTRFTETPLSGRGGNQANGSPVSGSPAMPNPGIVNGSVLESAVTNSPGINAVSPGIDNITLPASTMSVRGVEFVEIANIPQFNLLFGDVDSDGNHSEFGNFPGVDAMHVLRAADGRLNTVHEILVSTFSDGGGTAGYYSTPYTEGDIFIMPEARNRYPFPQQPQPLQFFLTAAQIREAIGLGAGSTFPIDVNGFTIDPVSGDIYLTFDNAAISASAGTTVSDPSGLPQNVTLRSGDIIRIPGPNTVFGFGPNAYTASGPNGAVASVVPGSAELVVTAAEVTAMMTNVACNVTRLPINVYGLEINPDQSFGPYVGSTGHLTSQLFFTVDNRGGSATPGVTGNICATAIFSTIGTAANPTAGSYAQINGVTMDRPDAAGINPVSFNSSFNAGPMDAIAIARHANLDMEQGRGIHLDGFPVDEVVTDTTVAWDGKIEVAGSGLKTPGQNFAVFATIKFVAPGGFLPRWSMDGTIVGGYPDLYVDPLGIAEPCPFIVPAGFGTCQFPVFQPLFSGGLNPVQPYLDPINGAVNGDTAFDLDLVAAIPVGVVSGFPGAMAVFQGLDLVTFELSDPVAFELD